MKKKNRQSTIEYNLMNHLENLKAQAEFAFDCVHDIENEDTVAMLHCRTQFWASWGFVKGMCEGFILMMPEEYKK